MNPRTRLSIESLENRLMPTAQPNFVFILSDDQDSESIQYMPRLQALLADQGTTFENMFVTNPVCWPVERLDPDRAILPQQPDP